MAKQTIKEKVDKILYESHLIRAKDIDEAVYNIIKVDFEK